MMCRKKPKKRNSLILDLLLPVVVIPIFLGVTLAQAGEKATLKIPKEKEIKKVTEPSKKPVKEKEIPAAKIETKEKKEKGEVAYSYDPTNKVDPFKSFIVVKKELEAKEPKTYLETLDVSQLTISAIILGSLGNWALVRDSKGDGHVIKIGTLIGKKSGRVIKILEKEVVVRESYKDIRGREIIRDVSMKLQLED
jgi:Tfp pilus assembly protein PilP